VLLSGESEGCHANFYLKGGKFAFHSDSSTPILNQAGKCTGWHLEKPKRVISTILVLTDGVTSLTGKNQCIGGDLTFDLILDRKKLPLRFKAEKGLFLAFPGHPCFGHQVREITGGHRASIVDFHFAGCLEV
jgi:hypothetical protein